jgi:prephenate dehydrogenase
MTIRAAIVGLGKIGASIGFALGRYPEALTVAGYDEDPKIAKTAEKMGAVSRGYLALHRCLRESRLVILACPLDDVREVLSLVAEEAPLGVVVIDTSPNKTQAAAWAQELLPEGQYFTGWTLSLNPEHLHNPELGVDAARADLFANSLIGITDPPGTPEKVLTLNSDLVSLLDAKPFFIDSVEADGLIALGHELPRVAALALLLATVDAPGWHEGRKLASSDYAKGTLPILSVNEREDLGLSLRMNRENVTRLIGDLIGALERVKHHLESGEDEALREDLDHAIDLRLLWLEQRKKLSWVSANDSVGDGPQTPSMFGEWFDSKFKRGKGA